ncbi:MAG TPA: hypothetical protein ENG87_05835, partial [Candidatus Pacearchaeota archaeon]|nr:hypothetical protein [Candidatus Pacearchaeota archaeon]
MANIQQAKQQVESARRQLAQQREKTKRISIERTQAQLRAQDLAGKTKFAEEQKRVSSAKTRMLEKIGVKEKELSSYEKQISEVESAQERNRKLTAAIKAYAKVGGSAGGDVDSIYKKYGREIATKAANIVESHKTRGMGDFQYKGTYISPEGLGMSISQEALGKGITEGTIISGGTYRSMDGGYTTYGNVPKIKDISVPAYENIFTGERIYESRVDVPVGYKEIRVTQQGLKVGEVAIPGTDIMLPTKYETTKRTKESYQPASDMYVSEPKGIPEGSRGTLFMRLPTPQERYEMARQKEREKELPIKVIKKGYSLFGKPYIEKRVKEGKVVLGAGGWLFKEAKPYVEKGI